MKEFWTAESGEKIVYYEALQFVKGIWKSRKRKWNGNWKLKLETEMGTKKMHQSLVLCFFIVCLLLYYLALWVMCFAFTLVLCFVITACCNLVWFTCETVWARDYWPPVLEQGQHFYYCSLVPRPTSSFNCLLCVKLIIIVQAVSSWSGPEVGVAATNYTPVRKWVWQLLTIMIVIVKH